MKAPLLIAALIALAGCAGGGRTAVPEPGPGDAAPDSIAVETLDIAPYRDEPADVQVPLEHDVPAALLENRADAGVEVVVDGFRVQVFSSLDQEEAALKQDAAETYWARLVERGELPRRMPEKATVYRFFRQPYYRVRVGDFTERADADTVAVLYARRFEGAFVVPDQVTVRR